MNTRVYWIEENLGIMPRPRGADWLDDEIRSLRMQQVDTIVSALTQDEVRELALTKEFEVCASYAICFVSLPIPDRSIPSSMHVFRDQIERLFEDYERGRRIVCHCHAGIGRASLIAAGILVRGGLNARAAFAKIAAARGCPVPDTEEQANCLERISPRLQRNISRPVTGA